VTSESAPINFFIAAPGREIEHDPVSEINIAPLRSGPIRIVTYHGSTRLGLLAVEAQIAHA
jgi:hypothetical protein